MNKAHRVVLTGALFAGVYLCEATETNKLAELERKIADLTTQVSELKTAQTNTPAENAKATWPEKIKIKGDMRYRFEHREADKKTNRSGHYLRARFGLYGDANEQINYGIRLATGKNNSPTSTNQGIGNYGAKKEVWLDQVYFTYSPDYLSGASITFGKMKKPWEKVSDLVFDGDFNPEGISANFKRISDSLRLMAQAGYFLMVEDNLNDVTVSSAQLAAKIAINEEVSLTIGSSAYLWTNIEEASPVKTNGNTIVNGTYAEDFDIVEGFGKLKLDNTPLPVNIYGNYAVNTAASSDVNTAWLFGAGTKVGKLSLDYNYRDLDEDAVLGYLTDATIAGGGSGVRGHKISAKYSLLKNWSTGATYYLAENSLGKEVNTFDFDLIIKF